MNKTDAIGRATFHHIASQDAVRVTNREIRWLKHIERHGPQSSVYLYELTKDTHRCKDTVQRDLQKLRAGGFLFLPPQQRDTERAEFNPYIYDLTKQAKSWLADQGLAEPTVRPTGHWWHAYMVSCVTSSIDIAAAREGVRYIPAHEILARKKGATLGIPVNGKTLIPDQLFALDYGGSYRAFVLEVDRGTEPMTSGNSRKSIKNMLDRYEVLMKEGQLRAHYRLRCSLTLLVSARARGRSDSIRRDLAERNGILSAITFIGMTEEPGRKTTFTNHLSGWITLEGRSVSIVGGATQEINYIQ